MKIIKNFGTFINEADKNNFLVAKTSKIPNSGKGLFTEKDIKKDETIAEFSGGELISQEEADKREAAHEGDYFIGMESGKLLDVYKSKCMARYANDAEGFGKIKGLKNNAYIVEQKKNRAFLVATKNIPAGEEIFVDYGHDYWDNFVAESIQESMKFAAASKEDKELTDMAKKLGKEEEYNSNNGWGFGGLAGKKYILSDGSYLVSGKVCYRHADGHHSVYLVTADTAEKIFDYKKIKDYLTNLS